MISLIHTTARPSVCEATADVWHDLADQPSLIEHVLTYESSYFYGHRAPMSPFAMNVVEPVSGSVVVGWNKAAKLSNGDILICVSDDSYPYKSWDTQITNTLWNPSKEAVLWVRQECVKPDGVEVLHYGLLCFPIFTRAYYRRYGYFLHPAYFARFSDFEFTLKAQRDGVIIDARERIAFRHQDHHAPEYVMDASSEKINAEHGPDELIFNARKAAGFPHLWPSWPESKAKCNVAAGSST